MVLGQCLTRHPRYSQGGAASQPTVNMAGELYEAVLGAVYVDGGSTAAAKFFSREFRLPDTIQEVPVPADALRGFETMSKA